MEKKFVVYPKKNAYGKSTVVSARLPDAMLQQLDKVATETGHSRNEMIVMCLQFALDHLEIAKE